MHHYTKGIATRAFDSKRRKMKEMVEDVTVPVNALGDEMKQLSSEELAEKTTQFRERLEKGETLDDILVEAFAVVREAALRELGGGGGGASLTLA